MHLHLIFGLLPALAAGAPFVEDSNPNHELAESFIGRAAFPGQIALSGWSIFRRQGCPNLSLLCPSGVCCSYATEVTSCCGKNCCASGYLCTGGTSSNPCCVAITSSTNTCGIVNTNPCSTPGYLPCSGVNFCCPPSTLCYIDNFNVARCSSKVTSTLSPTPTPTPTSTTSRSFSSTPTTTKTTTSTTSTTSLTRSSTSSSTTSTFEPIPTPFNSNDGSGSDSSSSHSHDDRGFWTPATIGGVAGGGAAALILMVLLICCCVRKCIGGGGGGSDGDYSHTGRWITPWKPTPIQRLSDHEIAALVRYRDTTQAWQAMYVTEGKRIEGHDHVDRVSWLEDFATRAVHQRHYQLRNGGGQLLAHLICGAVGWIPGAKVFVGPWSTLEFTKYALKCFGMSEKEDLNELYRKACSKAGIVTNLADYINKLEKKAKEMGKPKWLFKKAAKEIGKDEDVQAEILNQLNDYLTNELGPEAAAAVMEEAVSFIPWFGHAYGAYRGADKSNTRINKALDYLKEEALDFHLKVFVVNAY